MLARILHRTAIAPGIAALCWACASPGDAPIAPFPIPVDLETGPVLIGMGIGTDGTPVAATVDTLSPRTILDSQDARQQPRRRDLDVAVFSAGPGGTAPVAQALFRNVETLDLRPCGDAGQVETCQVGIDDSARALGGILGADVLARGAVRFDFGASSIQFFPDIAGNDEDRTKVMCEAVFAAPFYGGGTLLIAGAEVSYTGRRLAIGACFINEARETHPFADTCGSNPTDDAPPAGAPFGIHPLPGLEQGLDALFVVSTGLGISIITETTYNQYVQLRSRTPDPIPEGWTPEPLVPLDQLGSITVHLPSGPITGRRATLRNLALVSEVSENRGPCYERYANVLFTCHSLCEQGTSDACPCTNDNSFCRASSLVELDQAFEVAIVPDSATLIQALRDELRPDLPELNGILGTNALTALGIDVDYPHNRAIMRCGDTDPPTGPTGKPACQVWPAVLSTDGSSCQCSPAELNIDCP